MLICRLDIHNCFCTEIQTNCFLPGWLIEYDHIMMMRVQPFDVGATFLIGIIRCAQENPLCT